MKTGEIIRHLNVLYRGYRSYQCLSRIDLSLVTDLFRLMLLFCLHEIFIVVYHVLAYIIYYKTSLSQTDWYIVVCLGMS